MIKASGTSRFRERLPRITLVLAFIVWACGSAYPQDEATKESPRRALPAETAPQDIIKIETDLVPVDVTVTDAKGRLVRNLKKEDFKLYEDGVEQPIASLNVER